MTTPDDIPAHPAPPDPRDALIAALQAQNALLLAQNAALLARVAELERRLGLDSSNSGKPPSSDGLKKKPSRVRSLRERRGKPSGGQSGHPGKTLKRSATPDVTQDHFPSNCSGCGAAIDPATADGYSARQVFDLPEPQPLVVVEHRAHRCRCQACGTATRAAFPEGVAAPVQYGPRIAGVAVYLLHHQLLPEKRLAATMADLFGVKLACATLARMSRTCAARLQDFVAMLKLGVAAAPVKHLDETGFRIAGQTRWLHIASTLKLTFYRAAIRRGDLPDGLAGTVVHDHFKPYYQLKGVRHALCNAHHLRELQALIDIDREDWAARMQRLLRRASQATQRARDGGTPLSPVLIGLFERAYDRIIRDGLAFHAAQPALTRPAGLDRRGQTPRRVGHNLLRRLDARRDDVLRFLTDPEVPFTNNLAERDARMMKLRQKISGCFRSMQGAQDFAAIRSFTSTAKKQGWDVLRSINDVQAELIGRLQTC